MKKSAAIILTAVILALTTASAAIAQYPPQVKGKQIHRSSNDDAIVLPQEDPGTLPLTGANLTLFILVGLSAVTIGTIVVRRSRARRDS
jgi:LPXTG-motif cell wall-anchored protein